jgi:UDP-N-acetylmuramyl pentapeptide phosphotransferase/UDP-N-acetylglucosamine-1-phosphate transferase
MTKMISRGFSNGTVNPNIQSSLTPTYVGMLVIFNGILLLSIAVLIGLHSKWYFGVAVVIFLLFSISFLEMISPLPRRKKLLNTMLSEAEKNPIENLTIITALKKYILNGYK